jgi:hypothetical protein
MEQSKKYLCLFLAIAAILGCLDAKDNGHDDKIEVPLRVELSLSEKPCLNEDVTLGFRVEPLTDAPYTTIEISLSEGITLLSGNLSWEGSLKKNEVFVLQSVIKFEEYGFFVIKGQVMAGEPYYRFGRPDYLYICLEERRTEVTKEPPHDNWENFSMLFPMPENIELITHELFLSNEMVLHEEVSIIYTVTSSVDIPNARILMVLPMGGLDIIEIKNSADYSLNSERTDHPGVFAWTTNIRKGVPLEINVKVKPVQEGDEYVYVTFKGDLGGKGIVDTVDLFIEAYDCFSKVPLNKKPDAPMNVDLFSNGEFTLTSTVEVTCIVESFTDAVNTTVQILVPEEFEIIEGNQSWTGDLERNQIIELILRVNPLQYGEYVVEASAVSENPGYIFGKTDRLYVTLTDTKSTVHDTPPVDLSSISIPIQVDIPIEKKERQQEFIITPDSCNIEDITLEFRDDYTFVENESIPSPSSGQIQVYGYVHYRNYENTTWIPAKWATAYLYDKDTLSFDDYLGTTQVGTDGYFIFDPVNNTDDEGGTLDIYVKIVTSNSRNNVVNIWSTTFSAESDTLSKAKEHHPGKFPHHIIKYTTEHNNSKCHVYVNSILDTEGRFGLFLQVEVFFYDYFMSSSHLLNLHTTESRFHL